MTRVKDGRRAPRTPIRLQGSLAGRTSRAVTVLDLSLTGCLIQCDSLLDHGAILDLRFRLGGEPFAAKVRVTDSYVDGAAATDSPPTCLAGLQFLSLPAQEEARLLRFLEQERRRRSAHAASD